ncbi:MAG: hypothetical protein ACFFBD_00780, partial [Candidatus Hodarchaeota archaeon]
NNYFECIRPHLDPNSVIMCGDLLQLIQEDQFLIFENRYDLCFLFRMLPLLERLRKNSVAALLPKISSQWLIVSISLKSLAKEQDISVKQRALLRELLDHSYLEIIKRFSFPREEFVILKII